MSDEESRYFCYWILKYFPVGKSRFFVAKVALIDEDAHVSGFALISGARFCTFWVEVYYYGRGY